MGKYRIEILGNVAEGRTEAEVSCATGEGLPGLVALVYENGDGWQLELDTRSVGRTREEEFGLALALARKTLERYVNRRGENPPEGLTAAGFSLWLMEMDDGSAMGQRISD